MQQWYSMKLNDFAAGVFTNRYLKKSNSVFILDVSLTPNNKRFLLTNELKQTGFKMITGQLKDMICDDIIPIQDEEITDKLNELAKTIQRNL